MLATVKRRFGRARAHVPVERPDEAIAMVLRAGQLDSARITDDQALLDYEAYKNHINDHQAFPTAFDELDTTSSEAGRRAAQCGSSMLHFQDHRALMQTAYGYIGLGPECMRAGDVIAILYGCQWPVVLRPLQETGEYSLLGMAYVYGIMDGEAVQKHEAMGLEDTEFCIV